MSTVLIEIHHEDLDVTLMRIAAGIPGVGRRWIDEGAEIVAEKMWINVPVKSGELRQSITIESDGESAKIGPHVPYAVFVHEGTAPHEIRPRFAKALAFEIGGVTIFAKRVQHPGTHAQPFLKWTLDESLPLLNELALRLMHEEVAS